MASSQSRNRKRNGGAGEKIAVVGSGLMGRGIGQVFATAGFSVSLIDLNQQVLDSALQQISNSLDTMEKSGLLNEPKGTIYSRIATTPDITRGVSEASFVVEAVFENVEAKKDVFRRVEAGTVDSTIIATNTTAIPIATLAGVTAHPERVIGTHFWNPPHLVPAVEVIRGEKTSSGAVEETISLLKKAGKKPAIINRDVPGQIGIRILYAMIREATWLVENQIASPEDIDNIVKEALGTRLEVLGPLELADLSGIDLVENVANILYKSLDSSKSPQPLVKQMVSSGELGVKTGKGFYNWKNGRNAQTTIKERDAHLIKILKEQSAGS
jgi:3-hydroxybutyryl-CoA dehydrogenase